MADSEDVISKPEPEVTRDPQIERLADSAHELVRSIKAANGLPPHFPEDEILALADALQDAPPADFDAVLKAALYTRERFVATRERFIIEAPDDPDLPSIEAVKNSLNDTIAELSTVVAKAGREAANAALPTRDQDKDIAVAAEAVETEVTDVQRHVETTLAQTEHLLGTLESNAQQIQNYVDQSRHYHISFLNFTFSIDNLRFNIKTVGAILKSRLIDRAWLDKLRERLDKAAAAFTSAWEAAREVLQRVEPVLEAVQRLTKDVADLIGAVRSFVRRVFERSADGLKPGTVFRDVDAPWCPEMVVIPPGQFMVGSPDDDPEAHDNEKPQHLVTIAHGLAVGRYPVTFEEYDRFAEATGRELPSNSGWGRGRRPAIHASWNDATAYCEWLSRETGHAYRLLSEAEWEYACRAGTTARYWWGDEISPENANYGRNVGKTTEVGAYPGNPWGLYDMHGNVLEWVEDCWNDSYEGAPDDGGAWTSGDCGRRIVRGGPWSGYPRDLRSAFRGWYRSYVESGVIGFRVARPLSRSESVTP